MTNEERSRRMLATIEAAELAERSHGHRFYDSDPKQKTAPSPRLSTAREFYFACVRCGACVFEDVVGTVSEKYCGASR